jgi:thiamine pyrophosphate-dependent acetolactate synthase large subunit-like protein
VYGTEYANPDYRLVGQAFDIDLYRVANENSAEAAIRDALAAGGPAVIEALIDPSSYPTTPN